jgi:hypothetical protein
VKSSRSISVGRCLKTAFFHLLILDIQKYSDIRYRFHLSDIGGIVDHHCLEIVVGFVDIGGIVDHHCLDFVVGFVDIDWIVNHQCFVFLVRFYVNECFFYN